MDRVRVRRGEKKAVGSNGRHSGHLCRIKYVSRNGGKSEPLRATEENGSQPGVNDKRDSW